jgi:hypothetical protein
MPVFINGIEYEVYNSQCYRGIYLWLRHRDGHLATLRFQPPNYSWILDDILVTDVVFSTDIKTRLIQQCPKWYSESRISNKENS